MGRKGETPSLVKPKTDTQKELLKALQSHEMIVVVGPAGTGKTYVAAAYAAWALKTRKVDKIVLTRPTVAVSKSLGFFPGSLQEKMEPWAYPIIEVIKEILGPGDLESQLKNGNIEVVPLEVIRGRTFNNTFVLLDEAQNCTIAELKAYTTRIGTDSITVINGDVSQSDLVKEKDGLSKVIELVEQKEDLQEYVKVIRFSVEDVVRSGLCKAWVKAWM